MIESPIEFCEISIKITKNLPNHLLVIDFANGKEYNEEGILCYYFFNTDGVKI